jgi:hypothetical protein
VACYVFTVEDFHLLLSAQSPGALACFKVRIVSSPLLRVRYGVNFTDMSPFRAIRSELLHSLPMREETYGWNLEMQMLVAQKRARILEIPVNHRRRRGGISKVSGTFKGTILATFRIAATFFRVAFSNDRNHSTVAQTS